MLMLTPQVENADLQVHSLSPGFYRVHPNSPDADLFLDRWCEGTGMEVDHEEDLHLDIPERCIKSFTNDAENGGLSVGLVIE